MQLQHLLVLGRTIKRYTVQNIDRVLADVKKIYLYCDTTPSTRKCKKDQQLGQLKIYFGHGKPVANRQWVK